MILQIALFIRLPTARAQLDLGRPWPNGSEPSSAVEEFPFSWGSIIAKHKCSDFRAAELPPSRAALEELFGRHPSSNIRAYNR
ncbi:hypothetical protein PLESTB_000817600 [Pleodorina starrii]|uniref:Secreted protein n=1 Tax=Pleodorina starrii TaxID=330485 RepID=A0A9W6F2N7_9CHLO|nr:hypothetical protein PLESTB_000817600 [Pleodorina starrii]GLC64648.1 hypothetical protein PLESTF_000188500 [Pleodorina starrii]